MKIKEILEKTYETNVDTIAKKLPAGEKRVRDILKEIGCVPNGTGKKGWTYTGSDPSVLEKDFEEFIPHTAKKSKTKPSNSNSVKNKNNAIKKDSNHDIITDVNIYSGRDNNMKAEIQALLKGAIKEENNRIYKGIYFDKDIAGFLDKVQHGNKSEIINKIMRQYLIENELI